MQKVNGTYLMLVGLLYVQHLAKSIKKLFGINNNNTISRVSISALRVEIIK